MICWSICVVLEKKVSFEAAVKIMAANNIWMETLVKYFRLIWNEVKINLLKCHRYKQTHKQNHLLIFIFSDSFFHKTFIYLQISLSKPQVLIASISTVRFLLRNVGFFHSREHYLLLFEKHSMLRFYFPFLIYLKNHFHWYMLVLQFLKWKKLWC